MLHPELGVNGALNSCRLTGCGPAVSGSVSLKQRTYRCPPGLVTDARLKT
jgi:hypothetical protein